MIQTPKFEITPYINLGLRRKWWFIVPFFLTILGGTVFLVVCPKVYKASTLVFLEPQSIPESFVKSTVAETMEGRVATILQQLHSRTYLERIVKDFHLDEQQQSNEGFGRIIQAVWSYLPFVNKADHPDPQRQTSDRASLSKLVQELKTGLQVNTRSASIGSGGNDREQSLALEISFEWNNQELVAPMTNAITTRFIEENLNAREESAIGTTDFFDKETMALKVELEAREKDLEAFKREHMGTLPTELESNINILKQLQEQLGSLHRALEQEKQQAFFVKSQGEMSRTERASSSRAERGTTTGSGHGAQVTVDQLTNGSLEDLQADLKRLSSLYTDKHPDVIALKTRIEALKKEGRSPGPSAGDIASRLSRDKANLQLVAISANIDSYTKQIAEVEKQIQLYKQRVEVTPRVEMEMSKVLRDYQTVKLRYDTLLSKKLDSKLAEQLEKRKKGQQFRVIDPAVKPPYPFKPDPIRVILATIALAFGLGGALAYMREAMDPCFYHPEELEAYLGTNVIVSLPMSSREMNV